MRTVTFKSVLDQVLRRAGLDPADTGMTAARKEFFTDLINARVRQATEYAWWPELMVTESRTPTSDLIEYEESGEIALGEVQAVTDKDPTSNPTFTSYAFKMTASGVQICDEDVPATVYITYRRRPQKFTSTAYSAESTYSEGDLVLFTDGYVYQVTLTGETYGWNRIDFPYIFERYVVAGATADWLAQDGQREKAALEEARASEILEQECIRQFDQQGQLKRMNIMVD